MGKYALAAVLVSSLLILLLLFVRKGLRRFVGSIGVYALWLFVAISLLLPFPQMVYKAVAGRELFQQQSKFSVMNLVDLAQKNQKVVDNKSENEYDAVKRHLYPRRKQRRINFHNKGMQLILRKLYSTTNKI